MCIEVGLGVGIGEVGDIISVLSGLHVANVRLLTCVCVCVCLCVCVCVDIGVGLGLEGYIITVC